MSGGPRGAHTGRFVRRLVEAGIVDVADAFAGEVAVTDLSRSNHVSVVTVRGRARAVVKRPWVAADDLDAYAVELAAYRWLSSAPATARLAPGLLTALEGDRAIVLEPVDGVQSLHEVLAASPAESADLVAGLGRRLGTLHAAGAGGLVARRPWVLDVPGGGLPAMLAGDEAAAGAAAAIRSHPPLCEAIAELAATWEGHAPMHGDVKFDNVLVGPPPVRATWLVDWELAGLGEPAWDMAGVVDGLVMTGLVQGDDAYGTWAVVDDAVAPAVAGHRAVAGAGLAPAPGRLRLAAVARLAQTSVQLAVMGHELAEAAEASRRVLAGAARLAGEMAAVAACRP